MIIHLTVILKLECNSNARIRSWSRIWSFSGNIIMVFNTNSFLSRQLL